MISKEKTCNVDMSAQLRLKATKVVFGISAEVKFLTRTVSLLMFCFRGCNFVPSERACIYHFIIAHLGLARLVSIRFELFRF